MQRRGQASKKIFSLYTPEAERFATQRTCRKGTCCAAVAGDWQGRQRINDDYTEDQVRSHLALQDLQTPRPTSHQITHLQISKLYYTELIVPSLAPHVHHSNKHCTYHNKLRQPRYRPHVRRSKTSTDSRYGRHRSGSRQHLAPYHTSPPFRLGRS